MKSSVALLVQKLNYLALSLHIFDVDYRFHFEWFRFEILENGNGAVG